MPYCPICKEYFDGELTSCPNCGRDFEDDEFEGEKATWVLVARITDKVSADFAVETLHSYHIPAVLFSESGFFGQVGLNLPSLSGKGIGKFQVHVPGQFRQEAYQILDMILGDKWEKVDE
jgi:hypothetical protein